MSILRNSHLLFLGRIVICAVTLLLFKGLQAQDACTFNVRLGPTQDLSILNSVNYYEGNYYSVGIAIGADPPYANGTEIFRFDSVGNYHAVQFLNVAGKALEGWGWENFTSEDGVLYFTGYNDRAEGRDLLVGKYDIPSDSLIYTTIPNRNYPEADWYSGVGVVPAGEEILVYGNHYGDVNGVVNSQGVVDYVQGNLSVVPGLNIAVNFPSGAVVYDVLYTSRGTFVVMFLELRTNTFCEPYRRLHFQEYDDGFTNLIRTYSFPSSQNIVTRTGSLCEGADGSIYLHAMELDYLNTNPNCNAGYTLSPKVYKFNDTLGLTWTADFTREQDPDWESNVADIVPAGDGNFVTAYTQSILVDTTELVFQTALQLVKFSPEGELLFRRMYSAFGENDTVNVTNKVYDLKATPDGGFVMVGESRRRATNFQTDTTDAFTQRGWILKVDADGLLQPSCQDTTVSSVDIPREDGVSALVFPNPTSDLLNIRPEGRWGSTLTFQILDQFGRVVLRRDRNLPFTGSVNYSLPVDALPSGVYRVVVVDGTKRLVKTFVKQ